MVFCSGHISFTKVGINQLLLGDFPYDSPYSIEFSASCWITSGQAFMHILNKGIYGAFESITPKIDYRFNFSFMIN